MLDYGLISRLHVSVIRGLRGCLDGYHDIFGYSPAVVNCTLTP